jgi:hypothetical protein
MPLATCEAVDAETPHASLDLIVVIPCSGGVQENGRGRLFDDSLGEEEEKLQQRDRRK